MTSINTDFPATGPVTLKTPVRFADAIPDAADVVIIGGGVVGVFAALYLNRAGYKVVLCEKGRIAGEQSSRNWGWIRQQGRDEDELPIATHSLALWREVSEQVKGRTGFVEGNGVSFVASTQERMEQLSSWLEIANRHNLDSQMLTKKQLSELISRNPDMDASAHQWVGALNTPGDARAEPWQAVPVVAELAQSEGVIIREDCAVRTLDIANGNISGVHTESGLIKTTQVVLAAGSWTSLFARNLGINIPQLSVKAQVARTAILPEVLSGNAVDEKLAVRRRQDGSYTLALTDSHTLYIGPDAFRNVWIYRQMAVEGIKETRFNPAAPKGYPDAWTTKRKWSATDISPFERMRVLDPAPHARLTARMKSRFEKRFPEFGDVEITHSWVGMIDTMPDIVPIVDRDPTLDGLVIATGLSGHGFGIGPGFAKIVSHLIAGTDCGHNIKRFRATRFTDGSTLQPGPAL